MNDSRSTNVFRKVVLEYRRSGVWGHFIDEENPTQGIFTSDFIPKRSVTEYLPQEKSF